MSSDPHRAAPTWLPAEAGIWLFVLADMTVFAVFFGLILHYRADDHELFAQSQAHLSSGVGLANTILLLTGSLVVVLAVKAARAHQAVRARHLLAAGIGCGVAFGAFKLGEYVHLQDDGFTAHTNTFFLCYFMFTAVHLLHVGMGISLLAWARHTIEDAASSDMRLVESAGAFWHMVDLLWLVLFPMLYLIS